MVFEKLSASRGRGISASPARGGRETDRVQHSNDRASSPAHVHVAVVSWDGMHDKAAAIATPLQGRAASVDVIYSNHAGEPEEGPGSWHAVPQRWYFGWKFKKALELHRGAGRSGPLLLISADAAFDDWASLAARCATIMSAGEDIGVWAPDVDVTPWPSERVATAPATPDGCIDVFQTDGIVWALAPQIVAGMSMLDYAANNLGWGIDLTAIRLALNAGLRVRRDLTCCIRHPPDRGYDARRAESEMWAFARQLPPADRSWLSQTLNRFHGSAASARKSDPPSTIEVLMDATPSVSANSRVAEVHCRDGVVYVATTAPIEGTNTFVSVDEAEFNLSPCPDPFAAGDLQRLLPFNGADHEGGEKTINNLGQWQVAEWDTLRVAFPPQTSAARSLVPLTSPIPLGAGGGGKRFSARLAVHRGRGNLRVRMTNEDGRELHRRDVPFVAQFAGGDSPAGYQTVNLALPEIEAAIFLHVELDFHGAAVVSATDPYVFFLADPRLSDGDAAQGGVSRSIGRRIETASDLWWYRVVLPETLLTDATPIEVRRPDGTGVRAFSPQSGRVALRQNWGHAFELESSVAMAGIVWIDGAAAFPLTVEVGVNLVRIPPLYLTGRHALIELRDSAGMQIFWRDWCHTQRQLTSIEHLQRESRSPYPSDLMPQSLHRYRALRAHCAAGSPPEVLAQLDVAIEALEAGHEALRLRPLRFPRVEAPDVSVIIPAHNKIKVTYAGLCGLLLAWNRASFEVVFVDDGSTDDSAQIETIVEGITVVRNETPQRFIRSCNAGVAASRGRYVVLLNNDTEPTVGWLDEMIAAFGRFPNVGLAGSRLLYPDGRQQEAGGIIWGNGDPWNYGRLQNPWEPRFSYARQADYVSGAAMMTTRAIWDEVGGLSDYLEPMYFEDTDFAFKVREAGYATWYVPSSVVYHYEGLSSGTDTSSGFKRFQEVNRPKFKRRWSHAFAGFSKVGAAPDLEKDRGIAGRVLFVDYTTPTPDRDAGGYAALQEIRLVQSLGYKVTFLPENLAYMGGYTEDLQKMGVEMIVAPFFRSINEFLEARAGEFDAFYITRYHVMNNIAPTIRRLRHDARILMNGADLHYLRMLRKGIAENDRAQIEGARAVRDEELAAMRQADLVLSYNETEHAVIDVLSEGGVKVMPCPWVLEMPQTVPPRDGRAGLSFLGSFQHHPNVEGLRWFAREVMGPLSVARPDLRLSVYGSRMPDEIRALESATIDPVGYVEDAAEAYDSHLVFVAPLLSGAGVKGKVLTTLARGVPCVLSPVAAEGTGLRDGEDCLVARTPAEWADAVVRLADDADLWRRIAGAARRLAESRYSFARGRTMMRAAFEAVELFGAAG